MERTNAMQQETMTLPIERKVIVKEQDKATEERQASQLHRIKYPGNHFERPDGKEHNPDFF